MIWDAGIHDNDQSPIPLFISARFSTRREHPIISLPSKIISFT